MVLEPAWQILYEADGKEEDYDKSDMIQYVIRREFGVSDPDGGISAMLQARARARESCAPPVSDPELSSTYRESDVLPAWIGVSTSSGMWSVVERSMGFWSVLSLGRLWECSGWF